MGRLGTRASDGGYARRIPRSQNRDPGHPDFCGLKLLLVGECFDAWEFLAFEELEAGAAAGGDVSDLVGIAGLVDGRDRVAAADDGDGVLVGCDSLGDGVGAYGKARELE